MTGCSTHKSVRRRRCNGAEGRSKSRLGASVMNDPKGCRYVRDPQVCGGSMEKAERRNARKLHVPISALLCKSMQGRHLTKSTI